MYVCDNCSIHITLSKFSAWNIVKNNYYGIRLYYVDDNIVSNNIINKNSFVGIEINRGNYNDISENIITYNGRYGGIHLSYSNYNTGIANILVYNEYIENPYCEGNDIGLIYP